MKKIIGLLILVGSIAWSLTMVKSGIKYPFGLGFWGPNGHDGIWHLALAGSLSQFTFNNPVLNGEAIKNYHIGFDLLLSLLSKVTFLNTGILYFQILPPLFAVLIGFLTYKFVLLWTKSLKSSLLSVFFVYFSGSFAYLLNKGESTFWSQQAISTLVNPPFALSLVVILSGLILLLKQKYILSGLIFGTLIFIKVYAGLLILGGLFLVSIYELINSKIKVKNTLKVFITSLIISLILFIPFNRSSAGLIEFQPFWFLETMMGLSDRLGWDKFYSAMTTYKSGKMYIKEIIFYLIAFAIFIAGNFGTRLLFLKDIFKKLDTIKLILISVIGAGILVPTFFVQKGTPWNTIQFIYYSLFLSSILAGIALHNVKNLYIVFIILLTLPTSVITLKDVYIPGRPPAMLPNDEIEALNFLKNREYGTVLTYPYDSVKAGEAVNNPPRPLYLYESTAYVSAFSNKPVLLEDEVNLNILNYEYKEKLESIKEWYKETDDVKARRFLKVNSIKYVYWVKPQRALLGDSRLGLTKVFENNSVEIYTPESSN